VVLQGLRTTLRLVQAGVRVWGLVLALRLALESMSEALLVLVLVLALMVELTLILWKVQTAVVTVSRGWALA
jgi:hypothetical protein